MPSKFSKKRLNFGWNGRKAKRLVGEWKVHKRGRLGGEKGGISRGSRYGNPSGRDLNGYFKGGWEGGSTLYESLRFLGKWKSQEESEDKKPETMFFGKEERRWRRGKLEERGRVPVQGSSQKQILLPLPRESLVRGRKTGKIWEIPFQRLWWEAEGRSTASQQLESCLILLWITTTQRVWCSMGTSTIIYPKEPDF